MFIPRAFADGMFDPLPEGIFQFKLPFDPTLIFFLFIGFLYFRGLTKYKSKRVQNWQVACFSAGLFLVILALMPPIDPWSDRLFFVHMIQHMIISHLAVPLMTFGIPYVVVLKAVPYSIKKRFYFPVLRSKTIRAIFGFFSIPLVSIVFFMSNYLFWHIPYFYNLALLNDLWHILEHAFIAFASIMLWRNLIDPAPMKSSLSMPARMLFIAMITASNIILSAILTFAKKPLYAYQGIPQPDWWTWGYLQDQQLGGLIMWVGGGMIEFIAMTICFFVWANRQSK